MDKEKIIEIVKSYAKLNFECDYIDCPTNEDVEFVVDFLDGLPDYIPTPKPMISKDGNIGLYWDNQNIYIDLETEDCQYFSLFIRIRDENLESFGNYSPKKCITKLICFFETHDF